MTKSLIAIAACTVFLAGCSLFKTPNVTAGYYIENSPESKATIVLGSNNTQANAIHSALPAGATGAETGKAEANATAGTATSSGLFVNNTVGNRSADIDATAALEKLQNVKGTTAGQTQGRDSSPTTSTQTPTSTETKTTTVNTPVSVTKTGTAASSTAGAASATPAADASK